MSADPVTFAAPPPCTRPTLYFVGVSTTRSSIMQVFPRWTEVLGIDAEIRGYDAALHAPDEAYRTIVRHLREDPLAMGALVTTHKIDLLAAAGDLIDELDPHARTCDEVSCLSLRDGRLLGHAKDPITSAAAWRAFVPADHWQGDAEVLCLGAGGAAVAISAAVAGFERDADRPAAITFVDRGAERLAHLRAVHARLDTDVSFRYVVDDDPRGNDARLAALPARSLVINATGMGKDTPGSPLTDAGTFPERGLVWELNYRGDLVFLDQARSQREARHLTIEDGWVYFLHGWSAVIAEVFHLDLDDLTLQALDRAASSLRPT